MTQASILFVDDDPNVLSSLRRMLHPMRGEWTMRFACSGAEAIEILTKENFDVVVSDMRMPEMNGAQLLAKIKIGHPDLARVILSGHSERELAMQTVNVAHQFLNKPCDLEELTSVIGKTVMLRKLLQKRELCELANSVVRMPSLPKHYVAITQELNSESPSVDKVARIVEEDPAMTVTVLRLVNSGFFGLASRINSVQEAIGLLGLDLLRTLALATGIFSKYESTPTFSIENFSVRCVRVASFARQIARTMNQSKKLTEEIFIAAMLCDMGLLVLNTTVPDKSTQIRARALELGVPMDEAEKEILGATHSELGAYLMGLWGFEDGIVEAVAYHHHPSVAPQSVHLPPLAFVHAADALVPPCTDDPQPATLDKEYLKRLGMLDHVSEWQTLVQSANIEVNDTTHSMG